MSKSKLLAENNSVIIALTGSFGSGCTKIAEILEEKHNYHYEKISDFLRKEVKQRKINIGKLPLSKRRGKLQDMGNELRKEKDCGYLIKQTMKRVRRKKIEKPIVIDSIKNPREVIELRRYPNAYLLAVNTSFNTRWDRVKDKKYKGDYNQFVEDDERDKNEGLEWGQNVEKCVDLADIYITNDKNRDSKSDWEEFEKKLYNYINLIEEPGSRNPTIPELLMNNAYYTSLSSDCLKRQVGAIITIPGYERKYREVKASEVKEYVIASGYNAVPEKQQCCEVKFGECYRDKKRKEFLKKMKYCPNCKAKLDSFPYKCPVCGTDFIKEYRGKTLGLCRALHAEESAILQTSRLGGISLMGASLYTTTFPCLLCAKKIIAVGIKRVVWLEPYPDKEARGMLEKAGIELVEFEGIKARAFYELFSKTT